MKKCTSCEAEKPLTEFHKCSRWADGLQKHCKDCHKQLNQSHYKKNTKAYIARAVSQQKEVQELVRFIKEEASCSVCGDSHWWRLAFHHVDPQEKDIEVSKIKSLPALKTELAKCIIVCHNCHSDIHHGSLV